MILNIVILQIDGIMVDNDVVYGIKQLKKILLQSANSFCFNITPPVNGNININNQVQNPINCNNNINNIMI